MRLPAPVKCDNDGETAIAAAARDTDHMPRVLVIDDDRDLASMLVDYLEPEGFVVEVTHTGEEGLTQALAVDYNLIILDVMLPQINGLEVLRRLRTRSASPVIMLTARGEDVDRIVGLEIGADDYLAKPFNARELLARMHAVLRRARAAAPAGSADDVLVVGDVVLDGLARTVRRDGQPVELTSLEFDVLKALLAAAGRVVSREALFRTVLQREYSVLDRSIDNHVSSLRKKLGAQVGGTERIKSVRNAGYIYARTRRNPAESRS
jgi:two-component system response regulator CpxR